jgi:nucleoside-diphosphate-sugar epimerase
MRVFLTGATGFIGSHVARLLVRERCDVTALVRPGADLRRVADVRGSIRFLEGDLSEPHRLRAALAGDPPDLCLHLAWYAVPGKYLQATENLECVSGTTGLLQVLDAAGCPRFVLAGTCFEYDLEAGYLSESSPIRPMSVYAACKHATFLMAEQYQRERGRSFAGARIFYQYGPWEDERRLVPLVIRKLLAGGACPLSAGDQIRDFLHVEDVAAAIWAIARSGLEGPVNIGSSVPVSVAEIARQIGRLAERPDLIRLGEVESRPGDPPFICANTARLRDGTGWRPRHDLASGLAATIEWWRQEARRALP